MTTDTARLSLALPLVAALALLAGCGHDMWTESKLLPLDASPVFRDGSSSRPLVGDTVARGQARLDSAFFEGRSNGRLVDAFPMSVTRQVLNRGQERFDIYCSPCHGLAGEGNGMIVQRGFSPPPSYYAPRLLREPVGHFYDVITNGYGAMYSYSDRVEPDDRWAIVAYIRALQMTRRQSLARAPRARRSVQAALGPQGAAPDRGAAEPSVAVADDRRMPGGTQ